MGVALVSLAESPEPWPPLAPVIPMVTAFSPHVWSGDGRLSSVSVGGVAFLRWRVSGGHIHGLRISGTGCLSRFTGT